MNEEIERIYVAGTSVKFTQDYDHSSVIDLTDQDGRQRVASIASELDATSADAEDKAGYMEQISGGLEDTPERMEQSPDVMEETAGGSDGSGDAAHADQSTVDAEP